MAPLVSAEFAAFCQRQLLLLTQATGANLGAVYIAEEWLGGQSPGWLPVAVHPENAAAMLSGKALLGPAPKSGASTPSSGEPLTLSGEAAQWVTVEELEEGSMQFAIEPIAPEEQELNGDAEETHRLVAEAEHPKWLLSGRQQGGKAANAGTEPQLPAMELEADWNWSSEAEKSLPHFDSLHQAMQPLVLDGRAVGMVMAARKRQDWQSEDYGQLEKIAQTLSTACAMERRLQWLQRRVHQQEIAQEKQQDIIDNLLHQFRNPLTALRTFGKLLVRRLSPDDRNQAVAAGIVRESDRLQGLLAQIGETVEQFTLADPALSEPIVGELVADPDPAPSRLLPGRLAAEKGKVGGRCDDADRPALVLPQSASPALPAAKAELDELVSPLTGKPLVLAQHCLTELVGERLPSWEAIAQLRGQAVVASLESGLSPVLADGDALGEVLNNLVDNGLKYGSPEGTVAVSVRSSSAPAGIRGDSMPQHQEPFSPGSETELEAWQCIAISDDGPGIPEGDIPRLFERHYRGVQAEGAKPGTGLGLAIAKDLVEQMGGHIWVQSPAGPFHPKLIFELEDALNPELCPGSAFLVWLRSGG